MNDIGDFLKGAISAGYGVVGLFFLRFYWRTGDRFFVMFCAAFWMLGSIRLGMVLVADPMEHYYLYWIRLAAYLLILGAIIDKNLSRRK